MINRIFCYQWKSGSSSSSMFDFYSIDNFCGYLYISRYYFLERNWSKCDETEKCIFYTANANEKNYSMIRISSDDCHRFVRGLFLEVIMWEQNIPFVLKRKKKSNQLKLIEKLLKKISFSRVTYFNFWCAISLVTTRINQKLWKTLFNTSFNLVNLSEQLASFHI